MLRSAVAGRRLWATEMPENRLQRTREAYKPDVEVPLLALRRDAFAIAMAPLNAPIVIEGIGYFREPQPLDEQ